MKKDLDNKINVANPPAHVDMSYWRLLETSLIKLLIVGIDPFAHGGIGIAFSKAIWKEQLRRGWASITVLEALGVDLFETVTDERFTTPREFFFHLLTEHGIGFVNVSHHYVGAKLNKTTRWAFKHAENKNRRIMNRAVQVLLCGDPAIKMYQDLDHAVTCIHPSQLRPEFRIEWLQAWGHGRLNKAFDLGL